MYLHLYFLSYESVNNDLARCVFPMMAIDSVAFNPNLT